MQKERVFEMRVPFAVSRHLGSLLFAFVVILPFLASSIYFGSVASNQYESEIRFSVRGTAAAPAVDLLNFTALPGGSTQHSDAHIVVAYIKSPQVLSDIEVELALDIRDFYSGEHIDFLHRVDAEIPLEKFVENWNWFTSSEFNSTTGIATFRVRAFSAEAARQISQAVLSASELLINRLSADAKAQLIRSAEAEVTRTEARLAIARRAVQMFRNREQALDPSQQAATGQELITELEGNLLQLKARKTALLGQISEDSPSIRVLNRQIEALSEELSMQRARFGSGGGSRDVALGPNLSEAMTEYSGLVVELEFAEAAYTSALAALEASQAEARRQERYFAIVVSPTLPEVALYPKRILSVILILAMSVLIWFILYLMLQAIRDHSV